MGDSDSSTLVDLEKNHHSLVEKTRKALGGCVVGRHEHHDEAEHTSKMPCILSCGTSRRCCSDESLPVPLFVNPDPDIERRAPLYEHVKLSVSGMACSGCERGLQRALEKIPSIKDIHTDIATSQAQFCINLRTISVEDMLRHLHRTTSYKFKLVSEVKEGVQFLDVLVSDPNVLFRGDPPWGVTGVRGPAKDKDKRTMVQIMYDPRIISPRDLMEKGLVQPNAELAPVPPPPSVTAGKKQLRKEITYLIVSAIFTIPVIILAWAPVPVDDFTNDIVSLFLATAVQLSAWEFYPKAFKSLFHSKMADMDLLIVLSTTTAYVFSVIAFSLSGTGSALSEGSFFETSTMLVTLIRLGRFMSELARQKATESVSIRTLQAPTARLLTKNRAETRDVDVRLLQRGDIFRVPPHTRIPTDGIVVYGGSQVDESMMTGESRPVAKGIDSKVTAGTMNLDGQIDVSVTRMSWENSISQIGTLVENAELSKPKMQALADRVATFFVPAIIAIALSIFITWMLVGIYVYNKSKADATVAAVSYAIATLIVSCPCAIGLAVPMVIIIASGVAAKHGVIFRVPAAIETTKKATHVVLDKTGTLTEGKMVVIDDEYMLKPSISTWPHLLGLVADQKHPVARAIADYLYSRGLRHRTKFDTTTVVVGGGIEGRLEGEDGEVFKAGNLDWLGATSSQHVLDFTQRITSPPTPSTDSPIHQHALDYTLFGLTIDSELHALFALRDVLRPSTPGVISILQSRHITLSLVSGDDPRSVAHCATVLNIPASRTRARCSPAAKASYVAHLQSAGPEAVVLFVGDGTNDAVALTQADIGVALAGGTDVATSAADVVLARSDLRGLLVAMEVSARAVARVRFNFAWAAVYNAFAVLGAAGAFVWVKGGVRIPPEWAGLGEIVSVLPVVLVAFSLRFTRLGGSGGERSEVIQKG